MGRGLSLLMLVIVAATMAFVFGRSALPANARAAADPAISASSVLQADENDAVVTVDFNSGEASHWYVEWGTDTSYGGHCAIGGVAAGETQTNAVLGPGLVAGTLYHYRVVVLLFDGIAWSRTFPGPDNTVTTKSAPVTGSAPAITGAVAINASLTCNCFAIRANVDTRGASTALSLEYGLSASLGSTANLTTLPGAAGATYVDSAQGPTGLTPGATYFWRLVATNASGSTASDIQTVDMPAQPTNIPPTHNENDCIPGRTSWLRWTAEPFHATAGRSFNQSLGSGGTPKYTVMAMDDNTPAWLTVDDFTLALSGTPANAGVYRFQWCVVDTTGQASGIDVEIDVAAAPTTPPATTPPPPVAAPPALLHPATIAGKAAVGSTIHLLGARWKIQPTRITFQWQVRTSATAWRPIRGATHQTLHLSASFASRHIRGTERAWFAHRASVQASTRALLVTRRTL